MSTTAKTFIHNYNHYSILIIIIIPSLHVSLSLCFVIYVFLSLTNDVPASQKKKCYINKLDFSWCVMAVPTKLGRNLADTQHSNKWEIKCRAVAGSLRCSDKGSESNHTHQQSPNTSTSTTQDYKGCERSSGSVIYWRVALPQNHIQYKGTHWACQERRETRNLIFHISQCHYRLDCSA